MARGNRAKPGDDGAGLPSDPPECLTNEAEREAYRRLCTQLERVGQARASDLETVCIAAKRLARLAMIQAKLAVIEGNKTTLKKGG